MTDFPRYPKLRCPKTPSEALSRTRDILATAWAEMDESNSPRPVTADEAAVIAGEFAALAADKRQVVSDEKQDELLLQNYRLEVAEWYREQQELAALEANKKEMKRLALLGDEEKKKAAAMKRRQTTLQRSTRKRLTTLGIGGFGMSLLMLILSGRLRFIIVVPLP